MMHETLLPAFDARAKLAKALARMEKSGVVVVTDDSTQWPTGLCWVLLTGDPTKQPEVFDACVIVPEVLSDCFGVIAVPLWIVAPEGVARWQREWSILRLPALVLCRDGTPEYRIEGLRDWRSYCDEVAAAWRAVSAVAEGETR